jgi:hypothetical protein
MTDLEHMLERQAQWQKSRQSLTWPEKIRMAERVRESVMQLRAQPRPADLAGHREGEVNNER